MNYSVKDIVDFCEELFPSISPYTASRAKKALDQFESNGKTVQLTTLNAFDYLAQGDIFTEIPITYINDEGTEETILCKGMLLTNTCDNSRNDKLQFAAIHSIEELENNIGFQESVKHNKAYQFLYLPDSKLEDYFIDFGLISSFSRKVIEELLQRGKVQKIASLSQIGYYMFLAKLTVYFMRPEDVEANALRCETDYYNQ